MNDEPEEGGLLPSEPSYVQDGKFGRFERLRFLGQGGMARVYSAYDPALSRLVAIKMIRGGDPEMAERLKIEARAQASINHENVCRVHEVGEVDGIPYIAMQYIDGKQLGEYVSGIPMEQKLRLLKAVAEGVHAAHRVGLIHRDLKPSNIMVERGSDGAPAPRVMDFGLAREILKPGLTATGIIVGSPWYMSPEQAKGLRRQLDRRSDVYSLGVTAYEIITGRLPFEGANTIEVLMKVLNQDPTAMRALDATVPRDVEAIVMKCLEKEPSLRYDSAKALADDIQRYLDGEPIRAVAAGRLQRLALRIKRHPVIAAAAGASLAVMLTLTAMFLHSRWTAQRQAVMAQSFGQEAKEMESILRFASLLPLHDIRPEIAEVRSRMGKLQQEMRRDPIFRGPGLYAIGRGHLALHEYEQARNVLEQAWNTGYHGADAAYALGVAYSGLYQKEVQEAERIRNKEYRAVRMVEVNRLYGTPALDYLSQGRGSTFDPSEYVEARIAFIQKQYPEALARARQVAEKVSWLYEADKLAGDILAHQGNDLRDRGEIDQALALYQDAEKSYRAAITKGSSDPYAYEALCGLHADVMQMRTYHTGEFPQQDYDRALAVCGDAIRIDSDYAAAYAKISRVYYRRAEYQADHGADPAPVAERSIQSATRAVQLDARSAEAFNTRGNAYTLIAEYKREEGQDPRPSLSKAIASLKQAIAIDRSLVPPYTNLGLAYSRLAEYQNAHGGDAGRALASAIESLEEAVRISPGLSYIYNNLSIAHTDLGEYRLNRGQDPRKALQDAVESANHGLRLNPRFTFAFVNRGNAQVRMAEFEMSQGREGKKWARDSVESFQKAMELSPTDVYGPENLGKSYELLALNELKERKPPLSYCEKGRASLKKAEAIDPKDSGIYSLQARLDLVAARWEISNRRSPDAWLARASALLDRTLLANPASGEAWQAKGELEWRRSEWLISQGMSPDQAIEHGLDVLDQAQRMNPNNAEAFALRGVLLSLRGETAQANDALSKAFAMNGNLRHAYQAYLR